MNHSTSAPPARQGDSARAEHAAPRQPRLRILPVDKLILQELRRLTQRYGQDDVWPSNAGLAAAVGVGESTVGRRLRVLEQLGHVARVADRSNRTGRRLVLLDAPPPARFSCRRGSSKAPPRCEDRSSSPSAPRRKTPSSSTSAPKPAATTTTDSPSINIKTPVPGTAPDPELVKVAGWLIQRQGRKITNPGGYRHKLLERWTAGGVPEDIAAAFAAWNRAQAAQQAVQATPATFRPSPQIPNVPPPRPPLTRQEREREAAAALRLADEARKYLDQAAADPSNPWHRLPSVRCRAARG